MRPDEAAPRDGDVVVTRESRSRVHYTVRQLPGMAQFSTTAREDAERLARSFGQRHGVDVWYSDKAGAYDLVEACRPAASVRSRTDGAPAGDGVTATSRIPR